MLEHLGEFDAAKKLMAAVEASTASKVHTPDLGGQATTADVTSAVCAYIAASGKVAA
jgi:tartrate dehydrogenase/decarboxylase/D-malate dehydrogenase